MRSTYDFSFIRLPYYRPVVNPELCKGAAWNDLSLGVLMWLQYADDEVVFLHRPFYIIQKLVPEISLYVWTEEGRMQGDCALVFFEEEHVERSGVLREVALGVARDGG
jgi:hypothetical protein